MNLNESDSEFLVGYNATKMLKMLFSLNKIVKILILSSFREFLFSVDISILNLSLKICFNFDALKVFTSA